MSRSLRIAAAIGAVLMALASSAEAAPRLRHHRHHVASRRAGHHFSLSRVVAPMIGALRGAGGVVAEASHWLGHGNMTGTRGAWCQDFATFVLRRTGHHTVQSRLARDAVRAGQSISHPVPGAIMSLPHHTGFVVRVLGPGRVLLISGNHSHRVGIGVYSTRGARFALPS